MNPWWSAEEWYTEFMSGRISARTEISLLLERVKEVDRDLNAFITVDESGALKKAEELDKRREEGLPIGPLACVPFAVKDNISTWGIKTTCASKMLAEYTPPYDATVITRLQAADAIMIGKTNMDEFGMGSTGRYSLTGPTHNPWDLSRTAGGSSSGSAAAVAGGLVPFAIGSDTGGSIRQPASMTGIMGLKPTWGLVSRFGLAAFASSLDTVGILTRTAHDASNVLNVIAGTDPMDSTSTTEPVKDFHHRSQITMQGLRVGIPMAYLSGGAGEGGMTPEVESAMRSAVDHITTLGARIVDIELPNLDTCLSVYYLLATAEASTNLARYDGVRYGYRISDKTTETPAQMYRQTRKFGFGPEVRRRILLGSFCLSTGYYDQYYLKAAKVRRLILNQLNQAFQEVDVIVCPTSPVTAFPLEEPHIDPVTSYQLDRFTTIANLTGIPAVNINVGITRSRELPVGMQILGPHMAEALILAVARAFQDTTDFHLRRPPQHWAEDVEV